MTSAERVCDGVSAAARPACPPWCRVRHGNSQGEDDWLHVGEPIAVADDVVARLCMTVDPRTDEEDGPYVLVGSREYSPAEAAELGASLIRLAATGARPTPRSAV